MREWHKRKGTMNILYTSDIHTNDNHLFALFTAAEAEKVDAIIIGGDLIPHHLPEDKRLGLLDAQVLYLKKTMISAIKEFRQRRDIPIYLDLGNDDLIFGRKILEKYDNELFHLLHMRKHHLSDGVDVIGYMNVPPTPFQRKDWEKPDSTEIPHPKNNHVLLNGYATKTGNIEATTIDLASTDTIEKDLSQIAGIITKPFIFVSHSPPYATSLDMLDNGLHVGSLSIRKFIEEWSKRGLLIASLHGHIHESPLQSGSICHKIENSICINPGQRTGKRARLRYVVLNLNERQSPFKIRLEKYPG